MKLFELIVQAERVLDALASHPEYQELKQGNHLTNLDVTLGDLETFLAQLNQAYQEASLCDVDPKAEEMGCGASLPTFEQLFDESALSNSLSLLPQPTVTAINSLDQLLEERS